MSLIGLALAALLTGSVFGATSAVASPRLDDGTNLSFPYSYNGTLTTASCTNPARGAGFYGDLWVASSSAPGARFYLEQTASLSDPYLQVLSSRTTVATQDDDSGYGLDAYLASADLQAGWFLAATTFSWQATGSYILYSSVPLTLLTHCPQVITTSVASSATYGTPLTYWASTNMNQEVSLASLTPSVCTASSPTYDGNHAGTWTITTVSAGTCTVEATQAGSGRVDEAPPVRNSISVTPKTLTLSGLTASRPYDGTTTAVVTGSPGLQGVEGSDEVEVSGSITSAAYDSSHAGARLVTLHGLGLTGPQAANYLLNATIAGEIVQATQEVTLELPDSVTYGDSEGFSVSADSGLGVTVTSLTTDICAVSGDRLAGLAAGTCRVRAAQGGNVDYLAADDQDADVVIAPRTLSLTGLAASKGYDGSTDASVTGTPALTGVLGTDDVNLSGTITSASYDAPGAGARTVTVNGLTLVGEQAGNYRLDPGFTGEILPSAQVVSWADYSVVPSQNGDALPSASTSGEGALSYSVADAGSAGCAVADGRLSFSGLGSCRLTATAAATANNLEATTDITVTVARLQRSVSWTLPPRWKFADGGRAVPAATTDGDGGFSYTVVDAGDAGCALTGRTLTFAAAGSCVLRAQVPATTDWVSASADLAVTVIAGPPPAVTDVSVTMGLRQAAVSWTPSSHNGGAGEVTYAVAARPGGARCQTTLPWCVVTGLNPKTTYTFTITASTPAGASEPVSADGSFKAPRSVAPGAAPTSSTGDANATVTDPHGQPLTSVTAGGRLRVSVSGFSPSSLVSFYTYSTPVLLGEAVADEDGTAELALTVPSELEAGSHTLVAYGFAIDGTSARAVASYVVEVPAGNSDDASPLVPEPSSEPTSTPTASAGPTAPATVVPEPSPTEPTTSPAPSGSGGTTTTAPAGTRTIGGVAYPTYDPTSPENARESASTILTSLTLLSVLTAGVAGASALASASATAGAAAGGLGAAAAAGAGVAVAGAARPKRGRGTLKGVKVKHHKFRHEATAWGDRSVTWLSPLVDSYDTFSLGGPTRMNGWSPMIARLFGDGAYLRAIFGTWSLSLHLAGVTLGVIAAASAGWVAVPPTLGIVVAIVVLSCLDAGAGFGAALGYGAAVVIGGGLDSTDAARSLLAISLIFFAGTLAGTAARPLRRPPSTTASEWYDRLTDIVLATLIGAWALSAIVKATSAIAGVEFPLVEHTNEIVAVFGVALVVRYLLESVAARYYPMRLAAVAPPKLGFPSPRQQVISAGLRTALYLFFAYVYIGFTWYLAAGAVLFFAPSVIAAYQMKLPNLPQVVRWLPKGLIKTVVMLIIGGAFAALVKLLVPDSAQFVQIAFVVLGLPGLALGILGFFAREGDTFEMTWLYRILGIPLLLLGVALATGLITLF